MCRFKLYFMMNWRWFEEDCIPRGFHSSLVKMWDCWLDEVKIFSRKKIHHLPFFDYKLTQHLVVRCICETINQVSSTFFFTWKKKSTHSECSWLFGLGKVELKNRKSVGDYGSNDALLEYTKEPESLNFATSHILSNFFSLKFTSWLLWRTRP